MSTPANQDPRLDQAAASDESLLAAHEKLLGKQPDEKARYKLLPLNLLFVFSGLIFFAGTYLNRYSGNFDPHIFNENAHPTTGEVAVAKVDPLVLGKKQYDAICITCHQATGMGLPGAFPPLAGSEWVNGSDERLIRIVVYGVTGPLTVKGTTYAAAPMPTVGKVAGSAYNLSDDKVAAVLTYIRHEWGNNGPAITTEQVAAIRGKEGDRKPYVQEELLKLP
ncbi:MAG: cytochrome c [Verrucomicrobia bacterium]|nr:cytochrome c [Verrucomicrobiota bacterium]